MNTELIKNLEILQQYYLSEWKKNRLSKDNFRYMAYSKAIKTINKLDFKIKDISQVKKLSGIGKSIIEKIDEFLKTGYINKVEEIQKLTGNVTEKQLVIDSFLKIWGVGLVKAENLWNLGYRSIKNLINDSNVLNRQQIIGLKYYDDLQKKIPRINIVVIQTIIIYILDKTYGKDTYNLIVAGSYRRQKDFSNDIDILVTSEKFTLKDMVSTLEKWNVVTDTLSMRGEKFMGVAHCPKGNDPYFRLDIEFLPENEFAYGLLYFTGSGDFNREIRQYAKNKGYTLSQHGLKNNKTGEWLKATTEEHIFEILGLEYLKPKDRN